MAFFGFTCEYMMRNLLSIAITQIVQQTYWDNSTINGERCPAPANSSNASDEDDATPTGTYEWSEAVQGLILSSFYMGYIITHIPGGVLVERLGGKIMLLFGIVATSILTALTPLSISLGGSTLLIVNRIVMGLCQGFIYASVFGLLSTWIPLRERTTLGVFVLSGIQVREKKSFEIVRPHHTQSISIIISSDRSSQHISPACCCDILKAGNGHSTSTALSELFGVLLLRFSARKIRSQIDLSHRKKKTICDVNLACSSAMLICRRRRLNRFSPACRCGR